MGERKDEAEILALIHANRIAIWMRDFDGWADCFVHDTHLVRMGWWRQGGVFFRRGWDDISGRLRREMIERPTPNPRLAYDTKVENLALRISGDMAWASFEQHYPGGGLGGLPDPGLSYEFRVFERQDGRWKIAAIGLLDSGMGNSEDATLMLAEDGRVLRIAPAAHPLLEGDDDLVIRAGRLRVRDARTDRKLQAAIAWAATLDNSYMPSRGAIPVLMEAAEGLPTKIWWVIADVGTIRFSFGNTQVGEQRLAVASMVFGLSPAQARLAGMIAQGLTLGDAAERMGISHHTARTHLDRVFEKTGVHTQTALVRVLLTTISPT